jgi:hypothetical protein
MYKPCGANAGPRSSVYGGCDILWIQRCRDWAVVTVGRNTLVPGNLVMVAGGTLGSSAAPTGGAMALGWYFSVCGARCMLQGP